MAPLSRELAEVILPHEHYGTHLDGSGKTVDDQLEKQNFEHAGKTLAEIWGSTTVDGYPVIAEYIDPEHAEMDAVNLTNKSREWRAMHVRDSQYFTQIVKCANNACCRPARSSYFMLMKERFLTPPIPLLQTADGISSADTDIGTSGKFCSLFLTQLVLSCNPPRIARDFKVMPYDLYCPSVRSVLQKRVCRRCGTYHASISAVQIHQRQCQPEGNPVVVGEVPTVRTRPVRIAARRQRELMAVIINQDRM